MSLRFLTVLFAFAAFGLTAPAHAGCDLTDPACQTEGATKP